TQENRGVLTDQILESCSGQTAPHFLILMSSISSERQNLMERRKNELDWSSFGARRKMVIDSSWGSVFLCSEGHNFEDLKVFQRHFGNSIILKFFNYFFI